MGSATTSSPPMMMSNRPAPAELAAVLRRGAHPPLGEARFWGIQAMVVLIAGVHLLVDLHSSVETGEIPVGIPVALLIVPVGYAALRYGLSGSAATGIWATLLWLPDLLLPHDQGHVATDLVNLALVVVVAFFVGERIEAERLAHARVERATAERLAVEARYRRLFEATRAPILVLDAQDIIRDANPAAKALLGGDALGRPGKTLFGGEVALEERAGRVLSLPDGRDYRLEVVVLPTGQDSPSTQVILEDVTEERSEGRRARRYAQLVVQAEEDQRHRLARELHDEPLQLFLHLARRLESLGGISGVPQGVTDGLAEARRQALDAAVRLRGLAQDLRPPALDQLGLVAALSSLVADIEDEAGLATELQVTGDKAARLSPEVELGVFRIAQEAVRNTLRHAGARQLRVSLRFEPGELGLTVADDGRGFRPEELEEVAPAHFGLLGMAERARLLDGQLKVRSAPGEGTMVDAAIPLRARGGGKADHAL